MDLDVSESDTSDFLLAVKSSWKTGNTHVTRLEVESSMNIKLLKHLMKRLNVDEGSVFSINGPIDLTFLKKLPGWWKAMKTSATSPCRPLLTRL